jgi:exonuclease SbcC
VRLHRIELTGFGPFRERQTVDFDAFIGDGIFLISGRTGAGKSSILDGVTFALYGGVPRYDGGEKRLRSDHCEPGDPTEVRLEFTVGDRRWRVTRGPEYERPAKRGGGMTSEPARAELEEEVDGVWVGRAARPRDVALLLDEIVGLNQSQFQQVILLAQNKFSRFLLAGNNERQALLRTLFDSRRFEQYRDALDDRKREALRQLDAAGAHVRTLLEVVERLVADDAAARGAGDVDGADAVDRTDGANPSTPDGTASVADRIAAAEQAMQRAAYRAEAREQERAQADQAYARAAAEHARLTSLARAQHDLLRSRQSLARLEADAAEIAAAGARLGAARSAEMVRPALVARERAEGAAAAAQEAVDRAERVWHELRDDPEADPGAVAERLTGQLAVWKTALEQERSLPELARTVASESAAVADAERDLAELRGLGAQIPAELAALEARSAELAATAAAVPSLQASFARLQAQREAAIEAQSLAEAASSATEIYRAASAASAAASAAVAELLRRRLDGYAGELAASLRPGDDCPVCGAVEHPHPAETVGDIVTDEQFAAAEAARDDAAAAERRAADAASTARDALAAAQARAGGRGLAELDDEVSLAERALAAAQEAERERQSVMESKAELVAQEAAVADSLAALVAAQGSAREREVRAQERLAAAEAVVAEARGDDESVADRIAAGTRVRDAARAVVAAREDAERAAAALSDAEARMDAALAGTEFADADAVRAAFLDPAEQERIAARIAEHASELGATRQRLLELELELAGMDEEPIDVEAATLAMTTADDIRSAAIAAEESARNTVARIREMLEQVDSAHALVADQTAEAEAIARLADTVAGRVPNTMKMDLETFVLAAELEEIVAAANIRLGEMSSGRYALLHSDARAARGGASGLGIEVMDAHTGRSRPPQSLSGGETFLASLALALGLAEVVTARAGGIRLDTLFIDEGFGSLDAETLELAMRTLDQLRAGGRAVGIISHVEAMQEQLPAQVHVYATPNGPSMIRQESTLPV